MRIHNNVGGMSPAIFPRILNFLRVNLYLLIIFYLKTFY